jgi:TatD DNase family protein
MACAWQGYSKLRLVDTHCHLNLNLFRDDFDSVLTRAWDQGVERILIPGTELGNSQFAAELCDLHPNLFASVGVHPNEANEWNETSLQRLAVLIRHPKVVAVGEIGLDYYRKYARPALQKDVLQKQLNFAAEFNLPVIIHSRESLHELLPILTNWQEKLSAAGHPLASHPGVLHSYDGDLETARRAIAHGFFIGITGPVTFKNAAERQELVRDLPIDSLLIETDAPYLTPHPYRGRRNEPAYVSFVAEKIADLHQMEVEEVAERTSRNADRLFSWRAFD